MISIAKKVTNELIEAATVKLQHHQQLHRQHSIVKQKTSSDNATGFRTETRRGGDAYF